MIALRSSEPHVWRQTFSLLSLAAWTFVLFCWLAIHLIGWLVGPIHDWNFVAPPVAGWTWDDGALH